MIAILCLCHSSLAHEGGHGPSDSAALSKSTWTIAVTHKHFHGSFLSADEQVAKFETSGGKVQQVHRAELIESDRNWIAERLESIRKTNQAQPIRFVNLQIEPASSSYDEAGFTRMLQRCFNISNRSRKP